MFFLSKNKAECCGCSACEKSCPVEAIHFEKDDEGFNYPVIDKTVCINCGQCERICPVANPQYDNAAKPYVYAAILKNELQRMKSTSGGLFYAISKWILGKGGFVYGATIDDNHQVCHIEVDNEHDLQELRGSKYVQSEIGDIYKKIKDRLQAKSWCYFTGTGCQVAGLKAFLKRNYEMLITSDIVCHGVPSQWLFDQHISYLENKYKGKVVEYHFRNNEKGTGGERFIVETSKGKIKKVLNPTYNISPYLYSFMYGMTLRWSCYDCKFAKIPRQGDITLADYWGVKDFFPDMDNSKGMSLCLINTEQGKKVWDDIRKMCYYRESNVQDASFHNRNLIRTSILHEYRSSIYSKIRKDGYAIIAEREFRIANYNRMRLKALIEKSSFLTFCVNCLSKTINLIKKKI